MKKGKCIKCNLEFDKKTRSTRICDNCNITNCNRCGNLFKKLTNTSKICEKCLIKKCIICNNEFKHYSKQTCSQKCFYKLLSISTKRIHKETSGERYLKIKESNRTKLTKELIDSIEEVLKLTYVKDKKLISKKASNNKHSEKLINQYIEKFPEKWNKYKDNFFKGQLDKKVQLLNPDEFKELIHDINKYSHSFNLKKWKIGSKTQKRLFDFYIKTNDYLSKKETFPEKQIRRILEENNISFKREVCLNNKKHRIDFLLENKKVIEVNGDFWHANPEIYGEDVEKYHPLQLRTLVRYKNKVLFLSENNYELLEIWENEIDNNYEDVKNKILKYARSDNRKINRTNS